MEYKDEYYRNNLAVISGVFCSPFEFSHISHEERYYRTAISIMRKSGTYDLLPVVVSERVADIKQDPQARFAHITGQFRSSNRWDDEGKRHLDLFVFPNELEYADRDTYERDKNDVRLNGTICKPPVGRQTPGGREIADILLAVNRPFNGKSDYLPCICWGKNALWSSNLPVGTKLRVTGRIQSRGYEKTLADGSKEERTAYEVSIREMGVLDELQTEKTEDGEFQGVPGSGI